jgi:hypothetical protein
MQQLKLLNNSVAVELESPFLNLILNWFLSLQHISQISKAVLILPSMLVSNLGQNANHPDRGLLWFSSALKGK